MSADVANFPSGASSANSALSSFRPILLILPFPSYLPFPTSLLHPLAHSSFIHLLFQSQSLPSPSSLLPLPSPLLFLLFLLLSSSSSSFSSPLPQFHSPLSLLFSFSSLSSPLSLLSFFSLSSILRPHCVVLLTLLLCPCLNPRRRTFNTSTLLLHLTN